MAMSEGNRKPDAPAEEEPHGLDVTVIRRLLAMTPAERFRTAVNDARALAKFDAAVRRARRR